jgi:hypothetical protein
MRLINNNTACPPNATFRWSTFEIVFFSNSIDLNELLDAVFNAGYAFDLYFLEKLDFGIENRLLDFSKKNHRGTYHSMQNFILYKMAYLVLTFMAKDTF